jgi:quercetin dioxygenase-like cupin family protein
MMTLTDDKGSLRSTHPTYSALATTAESSKRKTPMHHRTLAMALILLAGAATAGRAPAQERGYPAVPLLSTGTNILGETIRYPTSGPAHITAAIVTLAPGAKTIVHKHGVPLFAYILEGELTVDYGAHGTRTYAQGQAFMEAMEVAHFGLNNGTVPVRLLAVYMGAQGAENVIPVK